MSSVPRRPNLRRPDTCAVCGGALRAGEAAIWDPARRHARCLGCEAVDPPSMESFAGASALRKSERLGEQRAVRVRGRVGPLAGIVIALAGEDAEQRAWARGAEGEIKLARTLERRTAQHGVLLLHDRRMPGTNANIDHLAIGPAGVSVIDAKRYRGRISVERRGGLLGRRTEHLLVNGRDRTRLVDGVLGQADAVRRAVGAGPYPTVAVRAALCFIDAEWGQFRRLEVRGVPVLGPRGASKLCAAEGPLDAKAIQRIAELLASRFVPA